MAFLVCLCSASVDLCQSFIYTVLPIKDVACESSTFFYRYQVKKVQYVVNPKLVKQFK